MSHLLHNGNYLMFLFIKQARQTVQFTASYNGDTAIWGEDAKLHIFFQKQAFISQQLKALDVIIH